MGVVDPGKKIDFHRQIFEKFRFLQAISQKTLIFFVGKFPKNFDFFRQFIKISIFQAQFAHLQLRTCRLLDPQAGLE